MVKNAKVLSIVAATLLLISYTYGLNDFTRGDPVPAPEPDVNVEGYGGIIAGVDIDGDSNTEIYVVNSMLDGAGDYIPRIYKYEPDGLGSWQIVWAATAPVDLQNTWPALQIGDLDQDGKQEIIWGAANWPTTNMPIPPRIMVYEEAGDGSDVMGIATADTHSAGENLHYLPNTSTSIMPDSSFNLRPTRFWVTDIDDDGTMEICYNDRKGSSNDLYFGVVSVSDVPDDGDGSETWTLEATMLTIGIIDSTYGFENKYDSFVIGSNLYLPEETSITKISATSANTYEHAAQLPPLEGGMTLNASQVTDLDGDGTLECVTAEYDYGSVDSSSIVLLQEDGSGGLTATDLFTQTPEAYGDTAWTSDPRFMGSAMGDVDGDGYADFIFGSRYTANNATIFRLAYRGGTITDPANYEFSIIDSASVQGGTSIWDVVAVGNIDDDPEDEILYGHQGAAGTFPNTGTQDIVVLDYLEAGIFDKYLLPVNFTVKQNYPNPFNPTTTIEYELNTTGEVLLSIYDLTGRKVVELVNGIQEPGSYRVVWNARKELGVKVASGTYIYEVRVNNATVTKKMIFLK